LAGFSPIAYRSEANVRRKACGVRRWGNGSDPASCEQLVGAVDGLGQDAAAQVARVERAAFGGGEDQRPSGRVAGARLEVRQLVPESRLHAHVAAASVGLGLPHPQPAAGQVDVAPAQREQLAQAQTGEDERGEDGPPVNVLAIAAGLGVQLARRGEQRLDVLGGVEEERRGLLVRSRRRFPVIGLRSIRPCSTACSRTCASSVSVLLIDSAESLPSRTLTCR
jgi:hypothetical protein